MQNYQELLVQKYSAEIDYCFNLPKGSKFPRMCKCKDRKIRFSVIGKQCAKSLLEYANREGFACRMYKALLEKNKNE